jgi:NadR type nicotinamide-nucleotide adenylyltransferase
LIVYVLETGEQTTPGTLRAAWLREIHPGVDIRITQNAPAFDRTSPATIAASTELLARWTAQATRADGPIDRVFTSEPYGSYLAELLGAEHVSVDRDRILVPVTGTMVRRAPARALRWLEPVVRAHYVPRVCIAGAESTGKSTLAQRLAAHFDAPWVEEYGRYYSLGKSERGALGSWESDEFLHIAYEQQRMEDDAARRADPVLICDTDALATRIWHEFYMGAMPHWPPLPSRISLYLLPYPDVPFVADAIREGEHRRYWMHERFISELSQLDARYVVLEGTYDERFRQAVAAVDALIEE